MKYDDGWALGLNLSSGQHPPPKGCFPFDCLGAVVSAGSGRPASGSLPMPVPAALQPGTPMVAVSPPPPAVAAPVGDEPEQLLSPGAGADVQAPLPQQQPAVNPALVPLPPPTPTSATGNHFTGLPTEDPTASPTKSRAAGAPPQLAPLGELNSGSPLSATFPPGAQQQQQQQHGATDAVQVTALKRASSLIASRDADLFVALGDVLDGRQQQPQQQRAAGAEEDKSLL